ncbi:hypothetical protein FRC02_006237 [Tulasnella sp. 418]|nr:hypothetical protein FRC02_006237 [Tulasnella sp. 418]
MPPALRSILLASILASQAAYATSNHCKYGESCWPTTTTWQKFNASVDGRLVAVLPPAAPCHEPRYDESTCATARSNWNDSFWRADQAGAYQTPYWERGLKGTCFIGTPVDQKCDQGLVPVLAVSASNADHVQKAVRFAKRHKLSVVVKNTGHDYLGRSTGAGSFMIWTHNLKGIGFSDAFIPSGAPGNYTAAPALTVQAGEQWIDVYKAAHENNVTVVGGFARSVGAAGGWALGGGHSPLGQKYGMGVDNIVQFTLVTPDGEHRTANDFDNTELFWALRGGGGSAWGVILSVTYKAHPALKNILCGVFLFSGSTPEAAFNFSTAALAAVPNMSDRLFSGYMIIIGSTLTFIAIQPDTEADPTDTGDFSYANASFAPILNYFTTHPDAGNVSLNWKKYRSFWDLFVDTVSDVLIGENTWYGSRLVPRDTFTTNSTQLANLFLAGNGGFLNIVAGGAVSVAPPDSVALHPAWRGPTLASVSLGFGAWSDDTDPVEIKRLQQQTTALTKRLGNVIGGVSGAYFNEADPYEPDWKEIFWGSHYDRLLRIKLSIDPDNLFTCNRCVGSDL